MDFLNHREGGMVFLVSISFSSLLLCSVQQMNARNCKRLREFEEIEISRRKCRAVGNLLDICMDFVLEFGLWSQKTSPFTYGGSITVQYTYFLYFCKKH
jgi:hypothetical protein